MVKTCRNIPHIHLHEKKANKEKWHGAEIQVVIEGNWTTYRVRVVWIVMLMYLISLDIFFFCVHKCLTRFIFFFSSQRSCTTCAKWLLLLLMRSFYSDLFQKHPSTICLSVFLLPCRINISVHVQHY